VISSEISSFGNCSNSALSANPVFLGNYNFASSSPLRVVSVEIIVYNVPHVVHAFESFFSDYITNQCITMGITRHDTEMHGNNRLPPIVRMTVSPNTYCVALRLLGKILFFIVLPISGSCQSMIYRLCY